MPSFPFLRQLRRALESGARQIKIHPTQVAELHTLRPNDLPGVHSVNFNGDQSEIVVVINDVRITPDPNVKPGSMYLQRNWLNEEHWEDVPEEEPTGDFVSPRPSTPPPEPKSLWQQIQEEE